MAELEAEDRYQIRKLQMEVDKKELDAQKARQERDRFLLEMEHKYNLLSEGGSIDPKTATISGVGTGTPVRNGKGSAQALLTAEPREAGS